ncbi:MAG: SRPBCC family protein [Anaerolineae bacterium]|nr:SRPBCC family protein [Anaerolineae bacterium]
MTLIDDRVLVSAPPEIVWELLSSLSSIPKWHVNCTQSSILTTQQEGAGVRCRLNMQAGPDIVLEILSWYSNLGYEYTVVDGPYRQSKGRIRLQAIPEGTTVQWTFEYEMGGFAASVRDMNTRRRLVNEVTASLKRLKKLVESTGIRMDDQTRERVSLRPAPTAKERAVLSENIARTLPAMKPVPGQPASETPDSAPLIIDEDDLPPVPEPLIIGEDDLPPVPGELEAMLAEAEPPLAKEDTRPNPAVTADAPAADTAESDSPAQSVPAPVVDEAPPAAAQPDEITPLAEEEAHEPDEPVTQANAPTLPRRPAEAETLPDAFEPVSAEDAAPVTETDSAESPAPAAEEAETLQVAAAEATPAPLLREEPRPVGPSIWEVFGMAPPSAEGAAPEQSVPVEETPAPEQNTQVAPAESDMDPAPQPPTSNLLRVREGRSSHPGQRAAAQQRTRRR